jgi:hypothetical protein
MPSQNAVDGTALPRAISCLRSSTKRIEAILFSKMERLRANPLLSTLGRRLRPALKAYLRSQMTAIHPDSSSCTRSGGVILCPLMLSQMQKMTATRRRFGKRFFHDKPTAMKRALGTSGQCIGGKIGGRRGIQSGFREKPCEEDQT